jgi:hypothetical protein
MRLHRWLAATFAMVATAALAGSALAQTGRDSSSRPAVEPPQATGQAPRANRAPIGHRQPTVKDVPPEDNLQPNPENREIDEKLSICRGC